jgi:hypothetical protein
MKRILLLGLVLLIVATAVTVTQVLDTALLPCAVTYKVVSRSTPITVIVNSQSQLTAITQNVTLGKIT